MNTKDTESRLKSLSDQTQVDNVHSLQGVTAITEQTSNIEEVKAPHETAKNSYRDSDLASKQSLELALAPEQNIEVIIILIFDLFSLFAKFISLQN